MNQCRTKLQKGGKFRTKKVVWKKRESTCINLPLCEELEDMKYMCIVISYYMP